MVGIFVQAFAAEPGRNGLATHLCGLRHLQTIRKLGYLIQLLKLEYRMSLVTEMLGGGGGM
jgi:hypothetical protein